MSSRPPLSAIACLTAGLIASATLHADQDAPPIDVNGLLKQLHVLRDQQAVQAKTSRQAAIQAISGAMGSTERSVKLWEDAVQATQMEGAGKEAAQFRAWRDTEGELFKEKEVQNAVHLHLEWLVLTLQRSNGAAPKDLLPAVIAYTKELLADQAWMEALDETIKKEKEAAAGPGPKKQGRQAAKDDTAIRRTHDSILNRKLENSIIVQWLKLGDFVNLDKWEGNPGSLDGIYKNFVQPELRAEKDTRVFDYWDMKLKKEADLATKSKLSFEVDKYNTLRRPTLLWERAQEYTYLGQKNRAVTEMFNLIKAYPTHPDASEWTNALETFIAPAAPDANPPTSAAPATPAAPAVTAIPPAAAPAIPPPPAAQPFVPSNGPTPTALLPGAQ